MAGTLQTPTSGTISGLQFAEDVNAALAALATLNQSASAPTAASTGLASTAGLVWHDTGTNKLWLRDQSDTTWILLGQFDETAKTFTPARKGIIPSAQLGQVVSFETGAVATGTTLIPYDDTIPQQTEGDQYLSATITPLSASSTLLIEVVIFLSSSAAQNMTAALFQDSGANAVAAMEQYQGGSGFNGPIVFRHKMTAGGTSATTFKVRAGGNSAGTTTFNGQTGSRYFGGALASSITVTEILP
jgi:hypothetical protein